MDDTASSNTSVEDRTDFGENPTTDALSEGFLNSLKPVIDRIDTGVKETQDSQEALAALLESIAEDFAKLASVAPSPVDIEEHVKRLHSVKRRVAVTNSTLQSVQDRLARIRSQVARQKAAAPPPPAAAAPQ
ncbi:SNAPIN protein homolog [Pollicipes pollicipes]|uniref:SNAPIN protein homolog n=1 Tax=Pollicipes pollicipes TaxID=41117 RepID=UPI00188492CF|nr:SNAPIN protein homolog [Pollicipes pollicipes]XP_037080122.1 SNAPIN protein homolog [Pollicipes pollicipes]XP_037080123.1 SNAPIN protein homolog [Pollicipes pollicipes]XP_037080124.1 SNAPIN protein homolog [Pollicipes pollicipes]XP_037080125.1 SNAPIN protein homolog [Pollicipes pollicipes]XP_037080126.1 SNAPIN protein homolog [Pollicipes pollicipes]